MEWEDQVGWVLERFIELLDFSQRSGIDFTAYCMAVNYTFIAILSMVKKEHGEKVVQQIIKCTLKDVDEVENLFKTMLKKTMKWKRHMVI